MRFFSSKGCGFHVAMHRHFLLLPFKWVDILLSGHGGYVGEGCETVGDCVVLSDNFPQDSKSCSNSCTSFHKCFQFLCPVISVICGDFRYIYLDGSVMNSVSLIK